jgi:serine/threonine protein kinase
MDRSRLIKQISQSGITCNGKRLRIVKELGSGGNGVALKCVDENQEVCVAKIYIPPDNRDLDAQTLARFEREVKLSSGLEHPNVIKALESGTLKIGAYSLPFYTMPLAPKTLRDFVGAWKTTDDLSSLFKLFLKAARGVVFLHSNGVIHRDLKPGNVLVSTDGTPWVADLGIAHVSPRFASGGLETVEKERLLNRDYYAPEQRFGSTKEVDHRADIYALGCIIYELLMGNPPVRNNSPGLATKDPSLESLDPIILKMTAYAPDERYSTLEDALDDLGIQFGWVLATSKGERPVLSRNIPSMSKLLKSSNELHRRRGIQLAKELGKEALPVLHDLMGHNRRDVRDAAAVALGEIGDESSLHYLVSAMYGNSGNPSASRPSSEKASLAISKFNKDLRLQACADITQAVRQWQVSQILKEVPSAEAFPAASRLVGEGLFVKDWGESPINILLEIDEEKSWHLVLKMIERGDDWSLRDAIKKMSPPRQIECLGLWLPRIKDSWHFTGIFELIRDMRIPEDEKRKQLYLLDKCVKDFSGRYKDRDEMRARVEDLLEDLE